MSYYFFDKFDSECLPELEKIVIETGLTERETCSKTRFWSGNALPARKKFYKELMIFYDPQSQTPLMIQTNNPDEKRKQVKRLIKSLIGTCHPTEIYKDPFRQLKYDLTEFED